MPRSSNRETSCVASVVTSPAGPFAREATAANARAYVLRTNATASCSARLAANVALAANAASQKSRPPAGTSWLAVASAALAARRVEPRRTRYGWVAVRSGQRVTVGPSCGRTAPLSSAPSQTSHHVVSQTPTLGVSMLDQRFRVHGSRKSRISMYYTAGFSNLWPLRPDSAVRRHLEPFSVGVGDIGLCRNRLRFRLPRPLFSEPIPS